MLDLQLETPRFVDQSPRVAERAATPASVEGCALAQRATIMIVDDEPINIKVVRKHLMTAGYEKFLDTSRPAEALALMRSGKPDVVLFDVVMPGLSGLDLLAQVRNDPQLTHIPVLILTACDNRETKVKALQLGATDFLAKPVEPTELLPRVRNALVVKAHHDSLANQARELERQVFRRTAELAASRLELIHCLARAAEYRDNDTGRHVIRVGRYAGIIARALGLNEKDAELIEHAAPLHDTGKIGISDAILLKPGKLEPHEFEYMKKHCGFGKRTFEPMSADDWEVVKSHTCLGEGLMTVEHSPVLAVAARIAMTHHEKWDGSGYPLGLAGEDIPLEGRITAVADVFDALSTERPYKPAIPIEKCFNILEAERGAHFDPQVLDVFLAQRTEIIRIRIELADIDR